MSFPLPVTTTSTLKRTDTKNATTTRVMQYQSVLRIPFGNGSSKRWTSSPWKGSATSRIFGFVLKKNTAVYPKLIVGEDCVNLLAGAGAVMFRVCWSQRCA